MFKHYSAYYLCYSCAIFAYYFSENQNIHLSSLQFFTEILAESFVITIFETRLCDRLPTDCPFKICILLAAMCRRSLKNLKVTYLPLTIIFILNGCSHIRYRFIGEHESLKPSVWCGACSYPRLTGVAAVQASTFPLRWVLDPAPGKCDLGSQAHKGL